MPVLLKVLVESLTGHTIGASTASTAPRALDAPQAPHDGKSRPFTTAEFDELCSAFGMPANIDLLMKAAQPHG